MTWSIMVFNIMIMLNTFVAPLINMFTLAITSNEHIPFSRIEVIQKLLTLTNTRYEFYNQ